MPWKNGGGETFEIAAAPEWSGIADFDWRISMALVAVDGPFSAFPGIDRTLCVLDGAGIELSIGSGEPHRLRPESPPLFFPGDVETTARLTAGPIRDLNVMTRRGAFTHSVEQIALTSALRLSSEGARTFAVCGGARFREGHRGTVLSRYDVLTGDIGEELDLQPVEASASVYVIRITAMRTSAVH